MKKLFKVYKKLTFLQGAAFTVSLTSIIGIAATINGINTFIPGTPISSSEMNTNFSILKSAIETGSSQIYIGTYDASLSVDPLGGSSGEYYVINTAGTINSVSYAVGDWIISNGSTWDKISKTPTVTKVFGRTGDVVALKGDYNLTKLSDVTITSPVTNQILKFNGTNWTNATFTEADPTVSSFAKVALPICSAGQFLKSSGSTLTCEAGAIFSGTANKVLVTNGSGAIATSAVTDTVLGYLTGVTSNIQTQLNALAPLGPFVDWSVGGVATLAPTRLNLTTANRVVVTNGGATPVASGVLDSELAFLTGVTSNIQTQLDSLLATTFTGTSNTAVMTNGLGELTSSSVTNAELGYLVGVSAPIQTQLDGKQPTISTITLLTAGSIQTNNKLAIAINSSGNGAGDTGELKFLELASSGNNYTGFKSPDTLAGNILYVMPATAPTAGQVLSSDGSNNLSWIAIPSAPVTTIFGRNGAVVAVAGDYNAGLITNTPAGDIAGVTVQAAINELDTEKQSIASFAGDVRGVLLTGVSLATSTAITATDSMLVAFGKLQAQNQALTTDKADLYNIAQTITAQSITALSLTGLQTPSNPQDAVNKAYVDGFGHWSKSGADLAFLTGKVGIGLSSPLYDLHVNGSIAGTSPFMNLSDARYKKEIEIVPNALEKILSIKGVSYKFKNEEFPDLKFSNHRELGVIAQTVEKVFPEAVSKDTNGFRSVAYTMLISPIIEALREINSKTTRLENENKMLKSYLCERDPEAAFCKI